MDVNMFAKSILPIGIFFSGTLILSNTAFLFLSVSFIQMLKVNPLFLRLHLVVYSIKGVLTSCNSSHFMGYPNSGAQP